MKSLLPSGRCASYTNRYTQLMKLLPIILWLIPTLAITQPVMGTYEHREEGVKFHTIKLRDSSKFIKSFGFWLNHGIQDLSKGYFTQSNDTVTLHFEPYNRSKSWMEIIKKDTMRRSFGTNFKRINKEHLGLTIEVFDEFFMPTPSMVTLIARDVDVGSIFNAESRFSFRSDNDVVTHLEINFLGYKKLMINLSEFRGTNSEIKVNLVLAENNTYRETFGEEKYVWRVRGKHLVEINEDGTRGKEYSMISRN